MMMRRQSFKTLQTVSDLLADAGVRHEEVSWTTGGQTAVGIEIPAKSPMIIIECHPYSYGYPDQVELSEVRDDGSFCYPIGWLDPKAAVDEVRTILKRRRK